LVIHTEEQGDKFGSELAFPDAILDDASKFDQLVNELADRSSRRKLKSAPPSLKAVFSRFAIAEEHQQVIEGTFKIMCRLHDEGRDHIWGYYVRNLARPLWLSKPGNQVDMIIGNPPWLAYSHMTPEMQVTFRSMSERRELWAGGQLSPHQDLSALFVVRACELYLRKGGRFGMVMPNAAIDREHYAGFRTGKYSDKLGDIRIAFSPPWDLRRIRPHFFPRASSVVFGARTDSSKRQDWDEERDPMAVPMPEEGEIWTGRLETINAPWSVASAWLKRVPGKVYHSGQISKSPYAPGFTQGAIIAPYLAFIVTKKESSPLGHAQGRMAVQSQRSVYEKKPWKNLPALSGVVETQFIRPLYSGENVYPFSTGKPKLAVIPCDKQSLLNQDSIDLYPGLQQWWAHATQIWEANRASERLSLMEQLDFQSKLTKQLPVPPFRIVYNTSGMHICCAKLRDRKAIVNSDLYWAPMNSEEETDFICAILNAPITTELARPMMSYGKDERHIHKHVWELPIPVFEHSNQIHRRISQLGAHAEKLVATYESEEGLVHFAAIRRHIRDAVFATVEGQELNELVFDMLA
jgi:hypothetical protein